MLKGWERVCTNPVTRKEAAAKIKPMGGLGGNNIQSDKTKKNVNGISRTQEKSAG